MKYYIEMEIEQVSGNRVYATLSQFGAKFKFVQPFERAWTPVQFDTPIDCVKHMRSLYDKAFTLSECESKILGPDYGPDGDLKSVFYYRITVESEY